MRTGSHGRRDPFGIRLILQVLQTQLSNSYVYLQAATVTAQVIQKPIAMHLMQHTMCTSLARLHHQPPSLQPGVHNYSSAATMVCNIRRRTHFATQATAVDQSAAGESYEQQAHQKGCERSPVQLTKLRYAPQTAIENAWPIDRKSLQILSNRTQQTVANPPTALQFPHNESVSARDSTEAAPISRRASSHSKLPKDLDPLLVNVMSELRNRRLLQKNDKLLVAVSSQQEHLCLAKILMDLSRAWNWQLVLTYLDVPADQQHSSISSTAQADVTKATVNIDLTTSGGCTESTQSQHTTHEQQQQFSYYNGLQCVSSLANDYGIPFVMGDSGEHTSQTVAALTNLAAQHNCTAVVLPTNATDCATQLLLKMFGSKEALNQQQQQQLQHTPAWFVENDIMSYPNLANQRLNICRVVQPLVNITTSQLSDFVARNGLLPWWMNTESCNLQRQHATGTGLPWAAGRQQSAAKIGANGTTQHLRLYEVGAAPQVNICQQHHRSSKYFGVTWHTQEARWAAQMVHNGQAHHLGFFNSEVDAAKAYDAEVLHLMKEGKLAAVRQINFPGDTYTQQTIMSARVPSDTVRQTSNKFAGVRWHKGVQKWQAVVRTNRSQRCLGYFGSEVDAALAYDNAVKQALSKGKLGKSKRILNFPDYSGRIQQHELMTHQTEAIQQETTVSLQPKMPTEGLVAVTRHSQMLTSTDESFIKNMVLPLLRQHFNPAVDVALTRAAMIFDANERWAKSLQQQVDSRPNSRASRIAMMKDRGLLHAMCASQAAFDNESANMLSYTPRLPVRRNGIKSRIYDLSILSDVSSLSGQYSQATDKVLIFPPEVAGIQARFAQHVRENVPELMGERLLVAVSGGQDSLCLLYLLHCLRGIFGWSLNVAHCDHQWRTDSAANAEHVRRLCEHWGLPFTCETVGDEETVRTEDQARQWRYSTLTRIAIATGCKVVVTGHTLTDQVETQLLNLFRGAGVKGLAAMRNARKMPLSSGVNKQTSVVRLVRPLLPFSRQDTTLLCSALALPVWVDSTNNDMSIARRNWIRLGLMPLLKEQFGVDIERHLTSYAQTAREIESQLHVRAQIVLKHVQVTESGKQFQPRAEQAMSSGSSNISVYYHVVALDRNKLKRVPVAVRRAAIKSLLSSMPGLKTQLTFDKIESVLQLIDAPNRSRTGTLAVVQLSSMRDYGLLVNSCGHPLDVPDVLETPCNLHVSVVVDKTCLRLMYSC